MNNTAMLVQLAEQGPKVQMMSFIIQSRNGHLIVIDGGNKADTGCLLETLHELGGGRPVIDAWFLTHPHCDHIDAFMEIIRGHAGELDIRHVYFQFPEASFIDAYESYEAHTIHEFEELLPRFQHLVTPVNEGDTYTFDGITFRVLAVPDPSVSVNAINNSSVVLRMEAEGQSVLFLGDLGIEGGSKLLQQYGTEGLQSDFVQMAHHGQSGVAREVYEAINPKVCLWCTPKWLWDNDAGKGYNTHTWQTILVRRWMEELGVRRHFVTKDGTHRIPLPMKWG